MRGMLASADRGWHCRRRALVEGWYVRRCGRCRSATHCRRPARRSTVTRVGTCLGPMPTKRHLHPTVHGRGDGRIDFRRPWHGSARRGDATGPQPVRTGGHRRGDDCCPARDFTVRAPDLGSVGVRRGCPGGWRCADPEGRGGLHRDALRLTPRCRQSIATALLPVGARAHSGAGHFPCSPRPATAEARAARSAVRAPLVTGNQSPKKRD